MAFQLIEAFILLDHFFGLLRIALEHGVDGGGQLHLGKAAHLRDDVVQLAQIFVEGFYDMVLAHTNSLSVRCGVNQTGP